MKRMGQPLIDRSLDKFDDNGVQVQFAITPYGNHESRRERIARLEALGSLDPNCQGCKEFYDHPTLDPFAPHHKPSPMCASGRRPHCTCPVCWG